MFLPATVDVTEPKTDIYLYTRFYIDLVIRKPLVSTKSRGFSCIENHGFSMSN